MAGLQKNDNSAIIEMLPDEEDTSDYETNFATLPEDTSSRKRSPAGDSQNNVDYAEDMKQQMAQNVTSYIWQAGTQRAKQAFSFYGNIDILRPYFDVEPRQVRVRLLDSMIPRLPGSQPQKVPVELYGPTMLVFTMVAILLFQMKTSGHTVQEGTLMGSAIGTCFLYWIGLSWFMWFLAYVCNTHITVVQLLSLTGYALFGHCIVLFITTVIHTSHDHFFFYMMWAIFGGLATFKTLFVLSSRTTGQSQKMIMCITFGIIHLCFLLYLHFAYHQVVEDISDIIDGPAVPHHQNLEVGDHIKKVVERSVNVPDSISNQVTNHGLPFIKPSTLGPDPAKQIMQKKVLPHIQQNLTHQVINSDIVKKASASLNENVTKHAPKLLNAIVAAGGQQKI